MSTKRMIRLSFEVSEEAVVTNGIRKVIEYLRLTDDGEVIIPIETDRGLLINNPAPCGTWEREEAP